MVTKKKLKNISKIILFDFYSRPSADGFGPMGSMDDLSNRKNFGYRNDNCNTPLFPGNRTTNISSRPKTSIGKQIFPKENNLFKLKEVNIPVTVCKLAVNTLFCQSNCYKVFNFELYFLYWLL